MNSVKHYIGAGFGTLAFSWAVALSWGGGQYVAWPLVFAALLAPTILAVLDARRGLLPQRVR